MTRYGNKVPDLTTKKVTERLAKESDGIAIKRLVAAREYLDGNAPAEISDKFGWPEQTIYSWLDRLESRSIEAAIHDDSPPGRPARLTDEEFAEFQQAVRQPPEESGFDVSAWNSTQAQAYLRREFDKDFSRRHIRRLMKEARR